jgi:hypothetical protein
MHKRNTVVLALALATPITIGVTMWSSLHRSDAIEILYFPAIILSVILSGMSHSPGAVAEWSSFIVYTLLYLIIFLILYALLLEFYLLRRGLAHLHKMDDKEPLEESSQSTLEAIGRAIHDVESKRRTHWLLDNTESVDLSESPDVLGARALEGSTDNRLSKSVLKEFRSRLVKQRGAVAAEAAIEKLKMDAKMRVSKESKPTNDIR